MNIFQQRTLLNNNGTLLNNNGTLSTNNVLITNFYYENPQVNFEEANLLTISILKMSNNFINKNYNLQEKLMEYDENNIQNIQKSLYNVNNLNNVNNYEKDNWDLEITLNQNYPTADISRNIDYNLFYDVMIEREKKQKIIISSKETKINIKNDDVESFAKTCNQLNCNGVFLSHNSGIMNKYNYEIDINSKNIIVYVHNTNYDFSKIKVAFDIIDNMSQKLNQLNVQNDYVISSETINDINQEYLFFTKQKDEIKNYTKKSIFNLLNQLDDVKLDKLDKFLSSKNLKSENVGLYKCNLCNFYTSNTLKGMAAHKRGCKKKHNCN